MTPEQRIERLERENRHFRRTGTVALTVAFVALAVCVGLLATGRAGAQNTPSPGVFTGSELELADSSGIVRAKLMMDGGQPILRFLSEQGMPRASIGLNQFGPLLFLARDNGRPGVSIGVGGSGPSMGLADTASHLRIPLHVTDSTGMPEIVLRDSTGHTIWTAPGQPKK